MTSHGSNAAKRRWALLASALRNKQVPDVTVDSCSVRQFHGFGLFPTESVEVDGSPAVRYTIGHGKHLTIRLPPRQLCAQDLIGFDNTGNICIWPAEEVMARYCVDNPGVLRDAHVCELGAGSSGLAGLAAAAAGAPASVLLTDGNENSVRALELVVRDNSELLSSGDTAVSCERFVWGEPLPGRRGMYDVVICADCLYFRESHADLVSRIDERLDWTGTALLFAPRRADTFQAFVNTVRLLQPHWQIEVIEKHHDAVWAEHVALCQTNPYYVPDIHYPILIRLRKFA